jgi:hypothetical protein
MAAGRMGDGGPDIVEGEMMSAAWRREGVLERPRATSWRRDGVLERPRMTSWWWPGRSHSRGDGESLETEIRDVADSKLRRLAMLGGDEDSELPIGDVDSVERLLPLAKLGSSRGRRLTQAEMALPRCRPPTARRTRVMARCTRAASGEEGSACSASSASVSMISRSACPSSPTKSIGYSFSHVNKTTSTLRASPIVVGRKLVNGGRTFGRSEQRAPSPSLRAASLRQQLAATRYAI